MSARCPCCSGDTYDACCGPFLNARTDAPTAEKLMRSRYTAFAVGDTAYLQRSWHPELAPVELELDPNQRWYRLDIVSATAGGLFDNEGTVEFAAHYRHPDGAGVLREVSRFARIHGRWVYLDGLVAGQVE